MAADWLQKLVDDGVISADQLAEAEQIASSMGIKVEEALVKNGYTTDAVIAECQANAFGHEFVDLTETEIPPSVIEMVPESVARENTVLPLGLSGESLVIAISDPLALDVMDKLRFILNREIDIKVSSKEQIQTAINRHYGQSETESVDSMLQEFTETAIDFTQTESSEGVVVEEEESEDIIQQALLELVKFSQVIGAKISGRRGGDAFRRDLSVEQVKEIYLWRKAGMSYTGIGNKMMAENWTDTKGRVFSNRSRS
jgi:type IV pilus assembly protein PilB